MDFLIGCANSSHHPCGRYSVFKTAFDGKFFTTSMIFESQEDSKRSLILRSVWYAKMHAICTIVENEANPGIASTVCTCFCCTLPLRLSMDVIRKISSYNNILLLLLGKCHYHSKMITGSDGNLFGRAIVHVAFVPGQASR